MRTIHRPMTPLKRHSLFAVVSLLCIMAISTFVCMNFDWLTETSASRANDRMGIVFVWLFANGAFFWWKFYEENR